MDNNQKNSYRPRMMPSRKVPVDENPGWKLTLAAVLMLLVVFGILLAPCSNPALAENALKNAGHTNVVLGPPDRFRCSRDEMVSNRFSSTNPHGDPSQGVVCCGYFFSGCSIRF